MSAAGTIRIGTYISTKGLDKGASAMSAKLKGLQSSVSAVSSTMTGLLGVFGVSLGATVFVRSIQSAMGDLDKLAKSSARLGISAHEFRALGLAAELTGTDFGNLEKGLQKLVVRFGDMQAGGGQAAKGFEQLGLAAGDFSGNTLDDFRLVADSIKDLESPADKASAAFHVFGKSGVDLLTLLEEGSDGIDRMIAEAEKLGGSFSDVEFQQLQMANDAISKMNFAFGSVIQKLAIELSPIITALVEQFTEWAGSSVGASSIISEAVSWVASAIGTVADIIHTVKLGFAAAQIGATLAMSVIAKAIALAGQALSNLLNMLPGMSVSFGETAQAISEDLYSLAESQADAFNKALIEEPPSTGINRAIDGIRSKAESAAAALRQAGKSIGDGISEGAMTATVATAELIEKLQESIDTFGMSATEAQLWKLSQEGASEAVIEQARALQTQLDEMSALQKQRDEMLSRADSITSSVQTPMEKFQMEIEELQQLFGEGLISDETFARAMERAQAGLGKEDVTSSELKLSSAATLGSQAARSAIFGHQFSMPENKQDKELKEINVAQREQLTVQRETLKELRRQREKPEFPL